MPPGRASSVLRGHFSEWLPALLVAAAGAAITLTREPALAPPPHCHGLLELIASIAARTWRDVTVSSMFTSSNLAATFVAIAVVTRMAQVLTSSLAAAIASGVALAMTPLFAPALAPSPAFAIALLGICGLTVFTTGNQVGAYRVSRVIAMFALTSAVIPSSAVPLALACAWVVRRSRTENGNRRVVGLAVAAVLAAPAVVWAALWPSGPVSVTCLLPHLSAAAMTQTVASTSAAIGAVPMAAALALLGLWTVVSSHPRGVAPVAALALFVLFSSPAGAATPLALAPAALVFWLFAAAGVAAIINALGASTLQRIGAAVLTLTFVTLQFLQWDTRAAAGIRTAAGHGGLSRNSFLELVNPAPAGAAFVVEDAATDIRVRALPTRTRDRRVMAAVDVDRAAIETLPEGTRLFALPAAQSRLRDLGLRLEPVAGPMTGLAEVLPGAECSPRLTLAWAPAPTLSSSTQLTLMASDTSARGPVYVFLASNERLVPQPAGWTTEALRGFHAREHTRSDPGFAAAVAIEAETYGATPGDLEAVAAGTHLTRLEVWRTPDAPLELAVRLAAAPVAAIARLADAAGGHALQLCPSYPFDIQPIGPARTR